MRDFSKEEADVINFIQQKVPLVPGPFDEIGLHTGLNAKQVIEIIKGLKEEGVVRNIAGIFSGEKLGYTMSLVAFKVPEKNIEQAASAINSHPGVSHNYLRDHEYNVWFTLAEENRECFDEAVKVLAKRSGAREYLVLKNEKMLKIGVKFPVGGGALPAEKKTYSDAGTASLETLTGEEKKAVELLQTDLPLTEAPFDEISEGTMETGRLFEIAMDLKKRGIMRRYSAVLRHGKAGYGHNAMTVWKSEGADITPFMEEEAISHLYLRTVYPGRWEYPLFAMIHAKSEVQLQDIIGRLAKQAPDYQVLRTVRELKKQRVKYFSPAFKEWRDSL